MSLHVWGAVRVDSGVFVRTNGLKMALRNICFVSGALAVCLSAGKKRASARFGLLIGPLKGIVDAKLGVYRSQYLGSSWIIDESLCQQQHKFTTMIACKSETFANRLNEAVPMYANGSKDMLLA